MTLLSAKVISWSDHLAMHNIVEHRHGYKMCIIYEIKLILIVCKIVE